MKPISKDEALYKAAAYCSLSEKCITDVREKLCKWGVEMLFHDEIVEHLQKEGFVNEERYAKAYALDKFRFNNWGKIKIATMLRSKNVKTECIEGALAAIDETEYFDTLSELIKTKSKKIKFSSTYERNGKLAQFAASKGFESHLIFDVINALPVR